MKLKGRTCRLLSLISQPGFVIQRDKWRAVYAGRTANIYVNSAIIRGWIKTGGEPSEWEKWNVITKLCELNFFHSNTKRKKQEVTSKMAYLKVWKWCECVLRVEYWKYRKTEAWASLEMQFVGHASHLWWDGVCDICKFQSARTGIKEALWGGALVASQQNCANQCIDAVSKNERKKHRDIPVTSSWKVSRNVRNRMYKVRNLLKVNSWQYNL